MVSQLLFKAFFTIILLITGIEAGEEIPLYISGHFALTGRHVSWTTGLYPAALLALEHINKDNSVLPGYRLELVANDSSADPGAAIRNLMSHIGTPPTKIMIFGSAMSKEDIALAETAKWWNLVQVGPTATYADLSERARFPLYYRTRMASTTFTEAKIELMKYFGWKRAAVVHQDLALFNTPAQRLAEELLAANMTLVTMETYSFNDPMTAVAKRLKDLDARIIFVFGFEEPVLYCELYRIGMHGPRYVYIWELFRHKIYADLQVECTDEEMAIITEGTFTVEQSFIRHDAIRTVSGLTGDEYKAQYENISSSLGYRESSYHSTAYDAMWAIAIALNQSRQNLPANKTLEDFSYEDSSIADVIAESLDTLEFEGVSGPVKFTETGDRHGRALIMRVGKEFEIAPIGYYDYRSRQFEWIEAVAWEDGKIPVDKGAVEIRSMRLEPALYYAAVVIVACVMALSLYFLTYNVLYRNRRLIKMSSPNMNNLIIAGGLLVYVAALCVGDEVLVTVPKKAGMCMARYWLLSIGFTVGFGALFSKTWRVHRIFTHRTTKSLKIKDSHLYCIVLSLLLIDITVLCAWTAIDPTVVLTYTFPKEATPDGEDLFIIPILEECRCKYSGIWLGLLFGYKGVILLLGVFLAWETRKVTYAQLNDSRYIGFAVYNVTVFCSIGVPSTMFLHQRQQDLQFILSTLCITFCTTMTLCIVFVPR
ncbi:gamma-aminobutyric acid type B receptor subunit 2-like [Ptychodera flava]|uniref:gamma-aminobutyric acid type B receptor subunit 2-like n=1 Tax=Ptychodera flava TaxID=63121 RepID=UPI003969BE32